MVHACLPEGYFALPEFVLYPTPRGRRTGVKGSTLALGGLACFFGLMTHGIVTFGLTGTMG